MQRLQTELKQYYHAARRRVSPRFDQECTRLTEIVTLGGFDCAYARQHEITIDHLQAAGINARLLRAINIPVASLDFFLQTRYRRPDSEESRNDDSAIDDRARRVAAACMALQLTVRDWQETAENQHEDASLWNEGAFRAHYGARVADRVRELVFGKDAANRVDDVDSDEDGALEERTALANRDDGDPEESSSSAGWWFFGARSDTSERGGSSGGAGDGREGDSWLDRGPNSIPRRPVNKQYHRSRLSRYVL